MAIVKLSHPVLIQHENGASHQFHAGEGQYVPDELMGHPRVLAAMEGGGENPLSESVQDAPADGEGDHTALSKDELIRMADELGVTIDKRWSAERIRSAIEAA